MAKSSNHHAALLNFTTEVIRGTEQLSDSISTKIIILFSIQFATNGLGYGGLVNINEAKGLMITISQAVVF